MASLLDMPCLPDIFVFAADAQHGGKKCKKNRLEGALTARGRMKAHDDAAIRAWLFSRIPGRSGVIRGKDAKIELYCRSGKRSGTAQRRLL